MSVRVVLHLETLDSGEMTWWAESPDLAAFSATESSLQRLADLCEEAVADELGGDEHIVWLFAGSEEFAGAPGVDAAREQNDRPERVQFVQHLVPA